MRASPFSASRTVVSSLKRKREGRRRDQRSSSGSVRSGSRTSTTRAPSLPSASTASRPTSGSGTRRALRSARGAPGPPAPEPEGRRPPPRRVVVQEEADQDRAPPAVRRAPQGHGQRLAQRGVAAQGALDRELVVGLAVGQEQEEGPLVEVGERLRGG